MKSIAQQTAEWLLTKPIGSITTVKDAKVYFPNGTDYNSANAAMAGLVKDGVLKRTAPGTYRILPEFTKYMVQRVWNQAPVGRNKKQPIDAKGEDVIEMLLVAMARAEPELIRLRDQDRAIKQLAG